MRVVSAAIVALLATPVLAQSIATIVEQPGQPDTQVVVAGTYEVDPAHTQVLWEVNHMGITMLGGMFGASDGTLTLDPEDLSASAVDVTFQIADMAVTFRVFADHLLSGDFFEANTYPTARFVSTAVSASDDDTASIEGELTIKGITHPMTIDAKLIGAGVNPMDEKLHVGFSGTATILRSDFDLGADAPSVSDEVRLTINAAFVAQ